MRSRSKNLLALKFLYLVILGFGLMACGRGSAPKDAGEQAGLDRARWMLGVWRNNGNGQVIYERWENTNDTLFAGSSYLVDEGDTVELEQIALRYQDNRLFYVATVPDQNQGEPIYFQLVSQTDSLVVFENPHHDFPTQISYRYQSPDSMVASISGIMHGEIRTLPFQLVRVVEL